MVTWTSQSKFKEGFFLDYCILTDIGKFSYVHKTLIFLHSEKTISK